MTNSPNDAIWLTRAAHDRLQAELDQLSRGAAAASPEVEGRIRELRAVLRRAEIGDKPDDGLVEPGMTITILFDGDSAPTTFLLAAPSFAHGDPQVDIDVYSPTSPLGTAISGKFPGDTFQYETPTGTVVAGRIVEAAPFGA